jgi:uncharacterized protein YkwD
MLVGGLALASSASPDRSARSPSVPPVDTLSAVNAAVVAATNKARRARGQSALAVDSALHRIACAYSRAMLDRNFFGHTAPDGTTPNDRVARSHRRLVGTVGENLWRQEGPRSSSPEALADRMVGEWLDSPPHRKNLLRPSFTHLGVCAVQRGESLRTTQLFAGVQAYLRPPLPSRARPGRVLPVELVAPETAAPSPSKYDIWDANAGRQATQAAPFRDTLRLPAAEGTYRPRFYVPTSDRRFTVYRGPRVVVAE